MGLTSARHVPTRAEQSCPSCGSSRRQHHRGKAPPCPHQRVRAPHQPRPAAAMTVVPAAPGRAQQLPGKAASLLGQAAQCPPTSDAPPANATSNDGSSSKLKWALVLQAGSEAFRLVSLVPQRCSEVSFVASERHPPLCHRSFPWTSGRGGDSDEWLRAHRGKNLPYDNVSRRAQATRCPGALAGTFSVGTGHGQPAQQTQLASPRCVRTALPGPRE